MDKQNTMSYFNAPIAPQRDAAGRLLAAATLIPACQVSVEQVFQLITANERLRVLTQQVRAATDMRAAKAALLPYVTPCGVFQQRGCRGLVRASGLLPIDMDHLGSPEEAGAMRDALSADKFLNPVLCFVSPSGRGVKAFVPYPEAAEEGRALQQAAEYTRWAMDYVRMAYAPSGAAQADVDTSGKDIARACFLCHDKGAKITVYSGAERPKK